MLASYNLCPECNSPGSQRPTPALPPLVEIVRRYGRVADCVNRKEFKRFVAFIQARWDPLPAADEEWEDGYRGEGWTNEGALAMCVQRFAFWPSDSELRREGPLSEAEAMKQVSNRPVDSLIQDFPRPLKDPRPEHEITETLSLLQDSLQRQLDNFMPSSNITVDLPKDFRELMRVTDGVKGAGVPSETDRLTLVQPLKYNVAEARMPGVAAGSDPSEYIKGSEISWWRKESFIPLAAWQLGGTNEWRSIYYVFGRDSKNESGLPTWKVFDHYDVVTDSYDNLSQFLQHETDHIETIPGGHGGGGILDPEDKYPDQTRFD